MINISISTNAIKMAALFCMIFIICLLSIPAESVEPVKSGKETMFPFDNPSLLKSPVKIKGPDSTLHIEASEVVTLGLYEIEGQRFAWAYVWVTNWKDLHLPGTVILLYLPGERIQNLFESAYVSNSEIDVDCFSISPPDGVELSSERPLYQVSQIKVSRHPSG